MKHTPVTYNGSKSNSGGHVKIIQSFPLFFREALKQGMAAAAASKTLFYIDHTPSIFHYDHSFKQRCCLFIWSHITTVPIMILHSYSTLSQDQRT